MTARDASVRRKNILHKYADNIPRRPAGSDAILPSPVFFHSFYWIGTIFQLDVADYVTRVAGPGWGVEFFNFNINSQNIYGEGSFPCRKWL